MIRGTTAQFKFRLPYNLSDISIIKITFWQEGYGGPDSTRPLPIVKILDQCTRSDLPNEIIATLNKEETLRFVDDRKAYVQVQGKTIDKVAFASKQVLVSVYPVYDDSILDEEIVPTPGPDINGIIYLDGGIIV